jgi:hypothetical protein
VTRTLGWLVAACLLAAYLLKPSPDDLIDRRERDAIRVADTVQVVARDTLIVVRTRTDSIMAVRTITDTIIHRDTVVRLIEVEREACDAVISACEARVAARDVRIATLERRNSAWLLLYGEMGARVPLHAIRDLDVGGEAGLALRLDRQTQLQAGATTRGEVRLSVRRQVALF